MGAMFEFLPIVLVVYGIAHSLLHRIQCAPANKDTRMINKSVFIYLEACTVANLIMEVM